MGETKKLFTELEDLFNYLDKFRMQQASIQFIQVYTKPERAEGKERHEPIVPLSRQK